jgi:D-3-phosphoglycerate dehydrogenase
MRILHLDENHPLLSERLAQAGFLNEFDYTSGKEAIEKKIGLYDGVVIRSRFPIDKRFLDKAAKLKFIARLGAGLENIATAYAEKKGVRLFAAPEGNRNAVGEHSLGMLLSLMNNFRRADNEVRSGVWLREENRGYELEGRVVGIIGYGNMGKAFARKLKGFNCTVFCYDIKEDVGDENATQVSMQTFREMVQVVSLHVPLTPLPQNLVDAGFINSFKNPFWLINTARGKCVVTSDLVDALKTGKVIGAGLDVLEYEKSSFESLFTGDALPDALKELIAMDNVLFTPHIGGWTIESKRKLAEVIAEKVLAEFPGSQTN